MTLGQEPRKDPFRLLLDVGTALVSSATGNEALQHVAAAIGEAMNVATVDIQYYDAEADALVEVGCWNREGVTDEDRAFLGVAIPLSERPTFRPIIDGRQLVEAHADDPDLPPEEKAAFARWGYQTTLDTPLMIGNEVLGILGVTETRFARRFLSMERERFEQLATMAAAAIRNARVFQREFEEGQRLGALLELVHVCASGTGADEVVAAACAACMSGLGAQRAEIVAGEALAEPRVSQPTGDWTRLALPLVAAGANDSQLVVDWSAERRVTDDEIAFAAAVARQVSAALEDIALEAAEA